MARSPRPRPKTSNLRSPRLSLCDISSVFLISTIVFVIFFNCSLLAPIIYQISSRRRHPDDLKEQKIHWYPINILLAVFNGFVVFLTLAYIGYFNHRRTRRLKHGNHLSWNILRLDADAEKLSRGERPRGRDTLSEGTNWLVDDYNTVVVDLKEFLAYEKKLGVASEDIEMANMNVYRPMEGRMRYLRDLRKVLELRKKALFANAIIVRDVRKDSYLAYGGMINLVKEFICVRESLIEFWDEGWMSAIGESGNLEVDLVILETASVQKVDGARAYLTYIQDENYQIWEVKRKGDKECRTANARDLRMVQVLEPVHKGKYGA